MKYIKHSSIESSQSCFTLKTSMIMVFGTTVKDEHMNWQNRSSCLFLFLFFSV